MDQHELVSAYRALGLPLAPTLVEMLNEHHEHRSERRGCGFTQASRWIATLINMPVAQRGANEVAAALFDADSSSLNGASVSPDAAFRALLPTLRHPESRLFASLLQALITPNRDSPSTQVSDSTATLTGFPMPLSVGSCALAEKYFLELAHYRIARRGQVNFVLGAADTPLLVEKRRLGDDHSCLSLVALRLNGVVLPAGSLFALADGARTPVAPRHGGQLPGGLVRAAACAGFRFLRLTTLVVAPDDRERAFRHQLQAQRAAGWFTPQTTTIDQLAQVANREYAAHRTIAELVSGFAVATNTDDRERFTTSG